MERQIVDVKKEGPGRGGAGGIVLPGAGRNAAAAGHQAGEVAAMANTRS